MNVSEVRGKGEGGMIEGRKEGRKDGWKKEGWNGRRKDGRME